MSRQCSLLWFLMVVSTLIQLGTQLHSLVAQEQLQLVEGAHGILDIPEA